MKKTNIIVAIKLNLTMNYNRENFNIIDDIQYLSGIIEFLNSNTKYIKQIFISEEDIIVDMNISEFKMLVKSINKKIEINIFKDSDSLKNYLEDINIIKCKKSLGISYDKINNEEVDPASTLIIISRNITYIDFTKHKEFCNKNIYFNLKEEELLKKAEYIMIEINPDVYSESFMYDMKNIFLQIYSKETCNKIIVITDTSKIWKKKKDLYKLIFYQYKFMDLKDIKYR